ncbi:hypothetical protein CQW23_09554 [Capsicum baccatum]|uniref:Glyoxal oxidase N-terminal domain-containing protein n=1 Tax=Capsicum baccatum TaxID=33114 RepID=A0A2G2WX41_CAPBA|nr:hypothetical protein CQW23_09554 [Capsicum baccatum]
MSAPNISKHNRSFSTTVDAVTDGESSEEEEDENEPVDSDYNSDELEFLEREKKREVNESLDNFLELEKGMSFKDLNEEKCLADGEGLTLMSDMQKVMGRLKDLEVQGEKWTKNFCSYAMELYNDFKIIARGCHVQANGDLGYEVVKGIDGMLGEKFWKVHPSHAMEPPGIHKMVGRSKVFRVRKKNEARKREGLWSKSRKGLKMTCGHCSATSHNLRTYPILQRREEVLQDVPLSAPQPSEEFVFMPTHGFSASSSQQISQPTDEVVGPSNKKRKAKDKLVAPSKRRLLGEWRLLHKAIGISAVHMQLRRNNNVVIFDTTDFGHSNLSLPGGHCRYDPNDMVSCEDCSAHSVLYDIGSNIFRALMLQTDP